MKSANRIIERKNREAIGLMGAGLSNKRLNGYPIEVYIEVLDKMISETNSPSEKQRLTRQKAEAVKKHNPAYFATYNKEGESTISLINSLIEKPTSYSSRNLNIDTSTSSDLLVGMRRLSVGYRGAFGLFKKLTGMTDAGQSNLARATYLQHMFSGRSVEQIFNEERVHEIEAAKLNVDLKEYKFQLNAQRQDMDRLISNAMKSAGITDRSYVYESLKYGADRMVSLQQRMGTSNPPTEKELRGYERKKIKQTRSGIIFGTKEKDYGAATLDDFYKLLSGRKKHKEFSKKEYDLFDELIGIILPDYPAPGSENPIGIISKYSEKSVEYKETDYGNKLKYTRDILEDSEAIEEAMFEINLAKSKTTQDIDKIIDSLVESMSYRGIPERTTRAKLDELYQLSREKIDPIAVIDPNKRKGGGELPFKSLKDPTSTRVGEIDDLYKLRAELEKYKTRGDNTGVIRLIEVVNSAIIGKGGDVRHIAKVVSSVRGSSVRNMQSAAALRIQGLTYGMWQMLYGSVIANTGEGTYINESMKGREFRLNGVEEQIKKVKHQGFDWKEGKYKGKDYWSESEIMTGIDLKGTYHIYTDQELPTAKLELNKQVFSQYQDTLSKELKLAKYENISYDNVMSFMMARARRGESRENIVKIFNNNELVGNIYDKVLSQYHALDKGMDITESLADFSEIVKQSVFEYKGIAATSGKVLSSIKYLFGTAFPQMSVMLEQDISGRASRLVAAGIDEATNTRLIMPKFEFTSDTLFKQEGAVKRLTIEERKERRLKRDASSITQKSIIGNESVELTSKSMINLKESVFGSFIKNIKHPEEETRLMVDSFHSSLKDVITKVISENFYKLSKMSGKERIDSVMETVGRVYKEYADPELFGELRSEVIKIAQQRFVSTVSINAPRYDDEGNDIGFELEDKSRYQRAREIEEANIEVKRAIDRMLKEEYPNIRRNLYGSTSESKNMVELLLSEIGDEEVLNKTILSLRDSFIKAGDSPLKKQIVSDEARKRLNLESVQRVKFDVVTDTNGNEIIEIGGRDRLTGKNTAFRYSIQDGTLKQVLDDFEVESKLKANDVLYHSNATSSMIKDRITKIAMEEDIARGDWEGNVKQVAKDFFGINTEKLSAEQIISGFASTEDLPLNKMHVITLSDIIENMTGARPSGSADVVYRPHQLFVMSLIENAKNFGGESIIGQHLLGMIDDEDQAKTLEEVKRLVKQQMAASKAGQIVEEIINDDINFGEGIEGPKDLYSRVNTVIEDTVKHYSEFLTEVKTGKYPIARNAVGMAAAVLGIGLVYKTAKDMIGTDPTDGVQTRIAMNDEGYGNSVSPDRYYGQGPVLNTSGGLFGMLSSASISDNLNDINDNDIERMFV